MSTAGPALRDIHVPPAAWWPPAPGWWLLAVCALALVAGVAWWLRRRVQRRPLVAVLREIDTLAAAFAQDDDAEKLADGASRLMRRVARRIDLAAASQSGAAWRAFVHSHARDAAMRASLDRLLAARYRANPDLDGPVLLTTLRIWCKRALKSGDTRKTSRREKSESIAGDKAACA